MSTTAERLKEARLENGYSPDELAKQVGVATNTYYIWERGQRLPADVYPVKLSSILNVPLLYLLGVSDDKDYHDRLSDAEAAAVAEAEDQEMLDHMIKLYKDLSVQTQELVRGIVGTAWSTEKMHGRLQSQRRTKSTVFDAKTIKGLKYRIIRNRESV